MPYCSELSLDKKTENLETCTSNLFKWFQQNHMKTTADNTNF